GCAKTLGGSGGEYTMSSPTIPPRAAGGFSPAKLRTRLAISWSAHKVSPLIPRAPTIFELLYNARPPPKKIRPPVIWCRPSSPPLGEARNFGSNKFDWPKLHRECPGWVKVYNLAVDSDNVSRL